MILKSPRSCSLSNSALPMTRLQHPAIIDRCTTMDFNLKYLEVQKQWKRLSRKLLGLQRTALLNLQQASRLGLMPKPRDYYQDKDDVKDKSGYKKPSPAATHQKQLQESCDHKEFKRHGNRHGSFATCQRCHARWKWEGTGWKLHGCCSKLSLPLPSSLTVVDGSIPHPGFQAQHLPLSKLTPKMKAVPTSSMDPPPPQGTRRCRAPSMTSSAGGHMKTAGQMPEVDFEMEEEDDWEEVSSLRERGDGHEPLASRT